MATLNKRGADSRLSEERLAGGMGEKAAKQGAELQLRRSVMACLLWENAAYEDGQSVSGNIAALIPQVNAETVAAIAREAKFEQKLRHVPLFIAREMLRYESHRGLVAKLLIELIRRPDELCEFLAIYWKEKKTPIAAQAKKGLAAAFRKFDEYQLAKWNRDNAIKLKDVLFLVHAKPVDEAQATLWKRLVDGELATPDTWEVGLSASKERSEKKDVWERLIEEKKLGAVAVLKNLRNMQQVGVSRSLISRAIIDASPSMLLPVNFLAARNAARDFTRQIEKLMFRCAKEWPKLPGWTVFVVDVSGSMGATISAKSEYSRIDVACAMAVLAAEVCENIIVYATAGSDMTRVHETKKINPHRGFALADEIVKNRLGGGGIFTRQCLEYIRKQEKEIPDRIIVFSDSQDCDHSNRVPMPFGKKNYIVDVSCNKNGVNYKGVWDAEVSGWSESFLKFIHGLEASQ